ncbi:hypothetical protein F4777DRAFT_593024 [Nemania sp. FL0916]|nr:hypothetical protein F4777DRAFT_593024 [Nemania sp. FL0916]
MTSIASILNPDEGEGEGDRPQGAGENKDAVDWVEHMSRATNQKDIVGDQPKADSPTRGVREAGDQAAGNQAASDQHGKSNIGAIRTTVSNRQFLFPYGNRSVTRRELARYGALNTTMGFKQPRLPLARLHAPGDYYLRRGSGNRNLANHSNPANHGNAASHGNSPNQGLQDPHHNSTGYGLQFPHRNPDYRGPHPSNTNTQLRDDLPLPQVHESAGFQNPRAHPVPSLALNPIQVSLKKFMRGNVRFSLVLGPEGIKEAPSSLIIAPRLAKRKPKGKKGGAINPNQPAHTNTGQPTPDTHQPTPNTHHRTLKDAVKQRCQTATLINTSGAIAIYHQEALADDIYYGNKWAGDLFCINHGFIFQYTRRRELGPENVDYIERTDRRYIFAWASFPEHEGWFKVINNNALIPVYGMKKPPADYECVFNLQKFFWLHTPYAMSTKGDALHARLIAPEHIIDSKEAEEANLFFVGMTLNGEPKKVAWRLATPEERVSPEARNALDMLPSYDPNGPYGIYPVYQGPSDVNSFGNPFPISPLGVINLGAQQQALAATRPLSNPNQNPRPTHPRFGNDFNSMGENNMFTLSGVPKFHGKPLTSASRRTVGNRNQNPRVTHPGFDNNFGSMRGNNMFTSSGVPKFDKNPVTSASRRRVLDGPSPSKPTSSNGTYTLIRNSDNWKHMGSLFETCNTLGIDMDTFDWDGPCSEDDEADSLFGDNPSGNDSLPVPDEEDDEDYDEDCVITAVRPIGQDDEGYDDDYDDDEDWDWDDENDEDFVP